MTASALLGRKIVEIVRTVSESPSIEGSKSDRGERVLAAKHYPEKLSELALKFPPEDSVFPVPNLYGMNVEQMCNVQRCLYCS